ncbi:inter-alpha-trypsin inhibitor heavy chain H3-like isoform X1 [Aquila chrysaetos chrysaetos]|uniref:inter-alpha-trypsin inhibitor heavy chain H3-like isoform X1 n=1 Tax=Aquila chrysaetos chrysaetos TaxID=223781 RepID=UPI00117695C1|nr:inter-alpha-trypsin inhibitor heavy chain H3-like isoform X1 [Aquila chrysaetos chrysaetos]XP_040974762.1 inter-alpha-trypsin inhibitor heavy chain H3-like isoform X1 [Aquila chrysaetos chrysaetos]
MENHLLLCIFLLIPAFASSDFLVAHVRNIKKRNADNDLVVNGIEIYSMKIDSKITSRFAHNVITSRAVNRGNVHKEVFFDVELPKTAFITNFSMTIDGVTYPGTIKEKEVAKKQYEKAVSKGQTAGLVKASGRKTEKFTVSVNIEAASKVTFELTYEELLKRQFGKYEMFIKVKPKQLVKDFEIEVNIFEPQGITELEAEGTFITNDLQNIIKKTFSDKKGHISFKPTLDQQRTCANCSQSVLDGDFTVRYDVKRTAPDDLQIVNGYFVHFFAPTNLPKLPKNVIFVIDISGSMSGRGIEQTREALLKILDDIKDDFFNFILFGSEVQTWKETLIKATPENLDEARKFVRGIDTAGMTNLHGGIMRGIDMLNAAHERNLVPKRSASIIIMLTDGQPNVGISNTQDIQEHVKKAIEGKYPLYNLGFGYGVDYSFLEKMALENKGLARRIYPDSDAALQLQGFYDEVSNPMLTDIELNYPENEILDLTKNNFKHFYDGSEIVVAGRFIDNNQNHLTVDVRGEGANDALSYTTQQDAQQTDKAFQEQEYIFGDYIERLWAYLTIEQLLEKRIAATGEEKENLTAKALDLSLKYKFVTPLTSMVVTKPEDYNNQDGIADKPIEAEAQAVTGVTLAPQSYLYTSHPTWYTSVDGDPHFIISVPQKEDAICFNINENPGAILNLINDPVTGITVNGELIGDKRANSDAKIQNTYFGKLGIANKHLDLKLTVTPEKITIQNGNEKTGFTWLDSVTLQQEGLTLIINRKKNLVLSMGSSASFVIVLHQVWKKHPLHQDFLGLYTLESDKLSEQTHGLLGQFFHPIDFTILEIHPGSDPKKPDATMIVKNNELTVTRGWQKDYRRDPKHGVDIPCWFVHNNGAGLIDGVHTDYIVSSLF